MGSIGFTLDITFDLALSVGLRLCIEVEAPTAYLYNFSSGRMRPEGTLRFKERLLSRCGWTTIFVPWYKVSVYTL